MSMGDRFGTSAKRLLPFVIAGAIPFAVLPLPGAPSDAAWLWASAALTVVVAAGALLILASDLDDDWLVAPALLYLVTVAILRESGGGNSSGLGPLAIVPVIGLAVYASKRAVAVGVVGAGLVYWLPVLAVGGARYPDSGWRIGVLFTCISAVMSAAIHELRGRLRHQADEMERLALTDELTGLPNRRAWLAALQGAAARAERGAEPFCVALVDLDDFKAVNDERGHAAGDALLEALARRWSDAVRAGDVIARAGGDEFGVLVFGDLADALSVAERLHASAGPSTCSIGIAAWRRQEPASELLARADRRLYDAKRGGRNRICVDDLADAVSAGATPAPVVAIV